MIEKSKILILIGIVVVIAILAATVFTSFGNDDEFDENLENAYSSYTNMSSKIEKYNHDQPDTDYLKMANVKKYLKTLKDIEKANNNTRNYLKICLESANDDVEKEYINLLINQTDLINNLIQFDIDCLKFKEKYINGKISVYAHNNEMKKIEKKYNATFEKIEKNSKAIGDLLAKNPDFEKRINNLDIGIEFTGGSFIRSLILSY